MNIAEYNIRIIIFHLAIIIGGLWLLTGFINTTKIRYLKVSLFIIAVVVIFAIIFSLFASLSYSSENFTTGVVVDCTHTGSFAGLMDSYAFRIEQSDGTNAWYHSSIFASSSFKKSIQGIEIGNNVKIYSGNFFNVFYKFELIH